MVLKLLDLLCKLQVVGTLSDVRLGQLGDSGALFGVLVAFRAACCSF